jgi:peroxisomal 3,2-trans-enoyl-CoA isomerase
MQLTTMENPDPTVSYTTKGKFATVTLNNPKQLNALTLAQWYRLAVVMDEIDAREDILVTILTGKGRFFCA